MKNYHILSTPLALARDYLSKVILSGDWAVDATLGKGRDLLFLAELVVEQGKVFGFDVQKQAIDYTTKVLIEKGWLTRTQIYQESHAEMIKYVPRKSIKAVMFNLGYLPGSDHTIITQPQTTVSALRQALDLLVDGGMITIVVYYGHPGGLLERESVENFLASLESKEYSVIKTEFFNRTNNPPFLLVVEKKR